MMNLMAQAAQLALEAAERRQKLAARVLDESHDKRPRPAATSSTKVTPEGKKVCQVVSAPGIEPRKLSFSDADNAGDPPKVFLQFGATTVVYYIYIYMI